ncbi:MAG TPA: hypothetical protein VGV63_01075 [Acidimicrobiales bacterium]|nr:hypothetical protein [Acidimicrobiales bacterium]
MTVPDDDLYTGAELAAIDGWTPPPPPAPPGPEGVAGLRRTTAGGALAAAVLLGLRDVLEPPPSDEAAVVVEVDGEADDAFVAVALRFDAGSPAATVAVLRQPDADARPGGETGGGARR